MKFELNVVKFEADVVTTSGGQQQGPWIPCRVGGVPVEQ